MVKATTAYLTSTRWNNTSASLRYPFSWSQLC